MNKKAYQQAEITVVEFSVQDVVCVSSVMDGSNIRLPIHEFDEYEG